MLVVVVVVVVLRVCSDSWRSNRGFSRQELLSRSGLPLPSPEYVSTYLIASLCYNEKHGIVSRGADKSLAQPGRKQATVTEDYDVHISYLSS